jgi:hypothetical protein
MPAYNKSADNKGRLLSLSLSLSLSLLFFFLFFLIYKLLGFCIWQPPNITGAKEIKKSLASNLRSL